IWPFVTNEDNRHEFCYEMYGWFGSNDLIIDENEIIQPHNISSVEFSLYISNKDCIKEGKYLIYSAPSDQFNYPEYFEAAYFWNDSLPYPQPYNQLNKTLQRKLQLFEPSIIHFTK